MRVNKSKLLQKSTVINEPIEEGKVWSKSKIEEDPPQQTNQIAREKKLPKSDKQENLLDKDISFDLERMFDPHNLDHIDENMRLDMYAMPNLKYHKQYKACVKILGARPLRIRTLVAPPMDTMAKRHNGQYVDKPIYSSEELSTTAQNPSKFAVMQRSNEKNVADKIIPSGDFNYKSWIIERKKLRTDVDNMGMTAEYLLRKPDKTLLEKRFLEQLQMEEEAATASVDDSQDVSHTGVVPTVKVTPRVDIPAPYALEIIDQYLRRNRLRLVDLFAKFDKPGKWTLTPDELRMGIKMANIDLTDNAVSDLIIALDKDYNNEIDFQELNSGLVAWRKERLKRKRIAVAENGIMEKTSDAEPTEPLPTTSSRSRTMSWPHDERNRPAFNPLNIGIHNAPPKSIFETADIPSSSHVEDDTKDQSTRVSDGHLPLKLSRANTWAGPCEIAASDESMDSVGSLHKGQKRESLLLPESDLRRERLAYDSPEKTVDMRKRMMGTRINFMNREDRALPEIIKTGCDRIDAHCARTTLTPELADIIQLFRSDRLKEYYEIVELCKERNIVLTPKMLKKSMLYPGDRTYAEINGHIRQPGLSLLPSDFGVGKRGDGNDDDSSCSGRARRGMRSTDLNMVYPFKKRVSPRVERKNLSTGRASVCRKLDCWMTYEEYEKLTGIMAIQYLKNKEPKYNPFWPGNVRDTLCMPPYDRPAEPIKGSKVLFQEIPRFKSSYPHYDRTVGVWPLGEGGVVQQGHIQKGNIQNWSIH